MKRPTPRKRLLPYLPAVTQHISRAYAKSCARRPFARQDPTNTPRASCQHCPCSGYVPFRFSLNSVDKLRCRR